MVAVILGGTFDTLHRGHEVLLKKAFELGDSVHIGLTSDRMARKKPLTEKVKPFSERKRNLERFLEDKFPGKAYLIKKIDDALKPALQEGLDVIVVSPGTQENAEKINLLRRRRGLKSLEIITIPWVLSEDRRPISDSRIREGEIDRDGGLK